MLMKKQANQVILFIILVCASLYALFLLYACISSDTQESIAILGFHNVVSDEIKEQDYPYNMWVDSESAFEEKIRYLYEQGYETWTMDELYAWKSGRLEKEGKVVVLTFDDGYYASAEPIASILKKYGFAGTTFVVGAYVEEKHTQKERQIQYVSLEDMKDQSVMRYYSHTYGLHEKKNGQYAIDLATKEALQNDISLQKTITDCTYFAYPFGYYNDILIEILKENGVKLAFGYHENVKAKRYGDFYTVPRFAVHAYTTMDTFQAMLESE